ncbi:hypothetical protein Y032_0585g320 [Ancylostoma ceylanicum]|uniref:Uncharacterized protein n=1 Tax=Ancylostoma ceylanicum TaxID=53326 RepID=A0A016WN00_9BILA|nr:hypothetical protein Y032_0585g320 [Ancylostoma ceylanicum]
MVVSQTFSTCQNEKEKQTWQQNKVIHIKLVGVLRQPEIELQEQYCDSLLNFSIATPVIQNHRARYWVYPYNIYRFRSWRQKQSGDNNKQKLQLVQVIVFVDLKFRGEK